MTLGPIGTRRKVKNTHVGLEMPSKLVDRLDVWREQQFVVPSRNAAIRRILEEFLDRVEKSP